MFFLKQGKANLKYILIVVILAAIAGGGILAYQYWWAAKEEVKAPELKPTVGESMQLNIYTNNRFKYSIEYPNDWHIFPELTKRLEAMSSLKTKYPLLTYETIEDYYQKHATEMESFMSNWNVNESELIILADTSAQEEKAFFDDVSTNKKTLTDFYPAHAIFIYPTGLSTDAKNIDRKEITIETITLSNGTSALRIHRRIEPEQIEIYVPYESNAKLYSGEIVKSLEFLVYPDKGAYPEDVFMNIINSLKFVD